MFKTLKTIILAGSLAFTGLVSLPEKNVEAATPVIQYGDQYGYVWDVQNRLQQLGFYKGLMDGVFGFQTKMAVINFQKSYGLSADGVVGPKTLSVLRANSFTVNEIQMMAQMVYGEARGEAYEGQVAIAAVILNRIDAKDFPNSVSGVLFEHGAFTAVSDGQYYNSPNSTAYKAVYHAIRGWDPSGGAVFYFNPSTATSKWIWSRPQIKRIGKHIFTR
nr:spore cortex-lytic enzyme [Bacillus taeanensis]